MESSATGSPLYKVVAFASAGLIVAAAVGLFVRFAPRLGRETATAALTAALAQSFPGSVPAVARTRPGALQISLTVRFDPTVDAEQAHQAFQRAKGIARAQNLEGIAEIEVELRGTSLTGGATAASRTFSWGSQELGAGRTATAEIIPPKGTEPPRQ